MRRPLPGRRIRARRCRSDTTLRDEFGRTVPLREFLGSQPVILDLGYFRCPALCGVVRADLLNALRGSGLVEGRDYKLVALSIDPAETPKEAAQAKEGDLSQAPFATGADWHYLTGRRSRCRGPQAVGFAIATTYGFASSCIPPGWWC